MEMREYICDELRKLEERENLKILFAAESGSRAWGFASTDSDYDVRFLYVRPTEFYLKLEEKRDVVEEPVTPVLDINGWDLQKALRLLYRSNATLFEWCNSPVIYMKTDFFDAFRGIVNEYFQAKPGLYHYLNMAKGNYREYLKTDIVRAKKYFYVLRPILACRWILERNCPPPMAFAELVETQLEMDLRGEVDSLLDIKKNAPETKLVPRIDRLNDFIVRELAGLEEKVAAVKDVKDNRWDTLDRMFLYGLSLQKGTKVSGEGLEERDGEK